MIDIKPYRGTEMTTAQTILEQLGGNRFIAMTGASLFLNTGNGLAFKIGRGAINKANKVRITLNDSDLYTVEFFSIRGIDIFNPRGMVENVYADKLREVFTTHTGMDTAL